MNCMLIETMIRGGGSFAIGAGNTTIVIATIWLVWMLALTVVLHLGQTIS